jgi:hypothetical protein
MTAAINAQTVYITITGLPVKPKEMKQYFLKDLFYVALPACRIKYWAAAITKP